MVFFMFFVRIDTVKCLCYLQQGAFTGRPHLDSWGHRPKNKAFVVLYNSLSIADQTFVRQKGIDAGEAKISQNFEKKSLLSMYVIFEQWYVTLSQVLWLRILSAFQGVCSLQIGGICLLTI